jgi:hypothetical protein
MDVILLTFGCKNLTNCTRRVRKYVRIIVYVSFLVRIFQIRLIGGKVTQRAHFFKKGHTEITEILFYGHTDLTDNTDFY